MKIFLVLVSIGVMGGMLYVQFGNEKLGGVGTKLGAITSSFSSAKSGGSDKDELYRKGVVGRWCFDSLVRQGFTMKGTVNYLKDGTFIIDADIGSKYGSQDLTGKGTYHIKEGVVYTDISEVFPVELRHLKGVDKFKKQYAEKIIALSKNEIELQGRAKKRYTFRRL
ncbi:hypothetical protein [Rubritalea sp.]|uniref:hypothetical protein n=1 Tax=Rubritalea sp. TaxID=2109375 RepID=UPI003EF1EBC3